MDGIIAESVFGPTEGGEGLLEASERKADDIEVAAFDARDVAAGAALNSVAACFVVRFSGGEITGDLLGGEHIEVHERGLDESEALGVGKSDEGDPCNDGVSVSRKSLEHVASVVRGTGFAEDVAFKSDFGIGANDDGGANGASGNEFGFGVSEALDEVVSRFTSVGSFVDRGRESGKREASLMENFGAADGSGSKDEFHRESRNFRKGRIL
jgi:hypothetical protein